MLEMNPQLRALLENGPNPFRENVSMPKLESPLELADKVFETLVKKFDNPSFPQYNDERQAGMQLFSLVKEIAQLERPHLKKLHTLAEKLVRETLLVGDDELSFNCSTLEEGEADEMFADPPKIDFQEIEQNKEPEDLESYVQKRRIVNSLIQGAAHHIQDLFYLYESEVEEISPILSKKYPLMMALGDRFYWTLPPEITENCAEVGADFKLDFSSKPMSVNVRASSFPLVLHEMGKGVMEALSLHSLPQDKETREYVLRAADKPNLEPWDLRVGPTIWKKFLKVFDPAEAQYRNSTYKSLVSLPTDVFHTAIKELLESEDPKKTFIHDLKVREIEKDK